MTKGLGYSWIEYNNLLFVITNINFRNMISTYYSLYDYSPTLDVSGMGLIVEATVYTFLVRYGRLTHLGRDKMTTSLQTIFLKWILVKWNVAFGSNVTKMCYMSIDNKQAFV